MEALEVFRKAGRMAGLDHSFDEITTIAVYDGTSVFTYVQGENLQDFKEDIQKYKVLVTWNGKCFDIPFLQSFTI